MSPIVETESAAALKAETRTWSQGILGQRRNFLVNASYQLRASLLTVSVVLVLLIFVNLILYSTSLNSSARILADAPELEAVILAQDRVEFWLIALASVVLLVGVFVVSILETHRTAGAVVNLRQRLHEVKLGNYGTHMTLRKGDNLIELETAFNDMARTLRDRTWEDVETLRGLADDVERAGGTPDAALAGSLRELAERKRCLVD
jgi:hypothetical protein